MLSSCVSEHAPSLPLDASVTFTVNVVLPAVVGMPEIVPRLLKERPVGREEPLARLQVSVPAPPVTCRLAL